MAFRLRSYHFESVMSFILKNKYFLALCLNRPECCGLHITSRPLGTQVGGAGHPLPRKGPSALGDVAEFWAWGTVDTK